MRRTLVTTRALLRERRLRRSRADLAYAVYLGVMLAIIVAAPAVRAAVLGLAESLPERIGPAFSTPITAAIACALGLAALAGAQTGPARASLPEIDLLHATDLPRRLLLRRGVIRVFALAAVLGTALAGLLVGAFAVRGDFDPASAAALALGGAGLGLLAATAMLVGQLGRGPRRLLAGCCGLLALALVLVSVAPGPEWIARLLEWTSIGAVLSGGVERLLFPVVVGMLLLVLCLLGIAAALWAPRIADRLTRDTLREQADRWDAVSALAISGELRAASQRVGAPVRVGRHWRWRLPQGLTGLIVVRDLLGLVRTPARSLAAFCGAAVSGAIIGAAVRPGAPGWAAAIAGVAALLSAYGAIGPWCRGLRAAGESAGSAPLLPLSSGGALARHLIVPGAFAVGMLTAGAALAATVSGADPLPAAAAGLTAAAIAVLLRLSGALKGPLPLGLLAPVPTPAGDLSAVSVLLWTLDGVMAAALVGAVLGALVASQWIAAAGAAAIAVALLAWWAVARLRAAEG